VSRRRAQGFNGFHRQRLIAKKPLRRFLRFTVAPTLCSARAGRPWQGSLSDRILIAENRCAALFVSTVSPDSETAALQCGRPVSIVPPFTRPDTWTRPPVSRVEWD